MVKRQWRKNLFNIQLRKIFWKINIVAERFIWNLKNRIYKRMTAVSKNLYFDVLIYIADKYDNAYHNTIKIKVY